MIPAFVETNVVGWLAQVLVLGTLGALLPFLFRIRHARSLLIYSHLILAACLILPFVQPWHTPVVSLPLTDAATGTEPLISQRGVGTIGDAGAIRWTRVLVWALAVGVAVRISWLGAGLWRIRRYRKASVPLRTAETDTTGWPTTPSAGFRISRDLDSPATFGVWRPVILLPESFLTMDRAVQQSVACHEWIHVRRCDWLVTMAEELSLAVLWFHPGAWWLVARARLAREEIVDAEVVRRMADRDAYLRALLEMAGRRRSRPVPVSMFSDGRELKWRVCALLSEVSMSRSRLFASYAAMAVLVGLGGWKALAAFPLVAAPVLQEGPAVPVTELTELKKALTAIAREVETKTGTVAGGVAPEGPAGVQAEPVPGGRGQRGRVAGPEATFFGIWNAAQAPVEESEPGVVRLQAVAGAGFARRVRLNGNVFPQSEAPGVTEGEVTVLLTFNTDGEIVDSRVSSGPDSLRRQALQAALQQNYGEQVSRVLQVVVEFVPPPPPPAPGAGGRGARGGGGGAPLPQ